MQIKPLNDMWMVVNATESPIIRTISESRNRSISLFMTDRKHETWAEITGRDGYRCVKVDISFTVKE